MEHYITQIHIDSLRHLNNIDIPLSEENRRHLLLTGKNGSGKTSLLEALKQNLSAINNHHWDSYKSCVAHSQKCNTAERKKYYERYKSGVDITFNNEDNLDSIFARKEFITAYFPADRKANITLAHGVEDIKLGIPYHFSDDPAQNLVKYMVHLKTQQAYARQENDMSAVENIQNWFERFENALRILLEDDTIRLEYDYRNYNFLIHQTGRLPFGFNELSDGYSSVIQITSSLMLRMERNWLLKGVICDYNLEGVALIDELETHLHIELQRKILPFLTKIFPRIQFIISTHSPYILTSVSDAVIFDLEKKVRFEDMSGYSIDNVAEAYFDSEDYSLTLEAQLKEYKSLLAIENPTDEQRSRRAELRTILKNVNGTLAARIRNEFDDLEAQRHHGQN
ncbi:MAG: AAA family ATPase [Selenomonadaceae bacterium]|nr:AAA family ATPase [Selenomonadaceae bacterium]